MLDTAQLQQLKQTNISAGRGNISARLAIAFAQSLNVNPFYITGETDEPGNAPNPRTAAQIRLPEACR